MELETRALGEAALAALRAITFEKHAGLDEGFDLSMHFREPAVLAIDRVRVELTLRTALGAVLTTALTVPIESYVQKTRLIFPVRGNLLVLNGNVVEGGHHEWSQHYAYDVAGLGTHLEMLRGGGAANSDFVGWGKEVMAPAAGTIAYARSDVPDNPAPNVTNAAALARMPDPEWAAGGNCVVIDHGDGEYSFLAHMQHGSVRVTSATTSSKAIHWGCSGIPATRRDRTSTIT